LTEQLYFQRVAHLAPRQIQPRLLVLVHTGFGCAYQIEHLPLGGAHFLQYGFGGNPAIHQPDPACLAVETLDLGEQST
jgi:hypothetical protein